MSNPPITCDEAAEGRFRSSAATHRGNTRSINEDAFVNRPDLGLWAVADGAGGHEAGDVAARHATAVLNALPAGLSDGQMLAEIRQRIGAAHQTLLSEGRRRGGATMVATTLVLLFARGDHFTCLWAGDSRAYLLRGGTLRQISRDHSLVQDMIEGGTLTAGEAEAHPHAHIITRALGARIPDFTLDMRSGRLLPGDHILICSDGLTNTMTGAEITFILSQSSGRFAERLVAAALAAVARDNVTAVTIEVAAQR